MRPPLSELHERINQARMIYHDAYLRHVKTGGHYVVVDFTYLEATMELLFVYHPLDYPTVRFARPMAELDDGRFTMSRKHPHD